MQKAKVDVVGNEVIIIGRSIESGEIEELKAPEIIKEKIVIPKNKEVKIYDREYDYIKNKKKLEHLIEIGVDLSKYSPRVIKSIIDGCSFKKLTIDENDQINKFCVECDDKGFISSYYGKQCRLDNMIKKLRENKDAIDVTNSYYSNGYNNKLLNYDNAYIEDNQPIINNQPIIKKQQAINDGYDNMDIDNILNSFIN